MFPKHQCPSCGEYVNDKAVMFSSLCLDCKIARADKRLAEESRGITSEWKD